MDKPSARITPPEPPRERIGIDVHFSSGGGSRFFHTDKKTVIALVEGMIQTETKVIFINQTAINFKNVKYLDFYGM